MEASIEQEPVAEAPVPEAAPEPVAEAPAPVEEVPTPVEDTAPAPVAAVDQPAVETPPAPAAVVETPPTPIEVAPAPVAPVDGLPPQTPAPAVASLPQAPAHIVGGGSEVVSPGFQTAPSQAIASPQPAQQGSDGFASGGGAITADSPQLQHSLTPIAGEGDPAAVGGVPVLAAPAVEGSDVAAPAA